MSGVVTFDCGDYRGGYYQRDDGQCLLWAHDGRNCGQTIQRLVPLDEALRIAKGGLHDEFS